MSTRNTAKQPKPQRRAKTVQLQVVMEIDEDGKFVASCPALQGCYSQGDSYEEAMENVRDVIEMCLDELRDEKRTPDLRYPKVIGVKQVEVIL